MITLREDDTAVQNKEGPCAFRMDLLYFYDVIIDDYSETVIRNSSSLSDL